MATLKQFLGLTSTLEIRNLFVYNTNQTTETNGGACCCYVVPSGITYAHVEIWGGGGGGSGACCCQWVYTNSTGGQYGVKRFAVTAGDVLTVCAAGSTCCGPNCKGPDGFPSFVSRSGSILACAAGGVGGCALCFYKGWNCTGVCVPSQRADLVQSSPVCADISQCSFQGQSVTHNFCFSDMWEGLNGAPKLNNNHRIGGSHCAYEFTKVGCCKLDNSWPAGGGNGSGSCGGGCCWGGWGAGGLVILTFYG
jgi:hypothetical protein